MALKEDFKDGNRVYLPISLATLQANEETTSDVDKDENEDTENLNRKIEYSILQQLIYREKSETIPHSRFRRIISYSQKQLEVPTSHLTGLTATMSIFGIEISKTTTSYTDFCEEMKQMEAVFVESLT